MVSPPRPAEKAVPSPAARAPTMDAPRIPTDPLVEDPTTEVFPGGISLRVAEALRKRDLSVVDQIGEGAMGTIYSAVHTELGVQRAIKALKSGLIGPYQKRFEDEARVLAGIENPHVVRVYDSFRDSDNGDRYVVFEYLKGASVGSMLYPHGDEQQGIPLETKTALDIVSQTCVGLEAAHARGLVHRDIKPDNLFVTTNESGAFVVKVLDFGVVKIINKAEMPSAAKTTAGEIIGTPHYMAPEQIQGRDNVDKRADIYSLGVVLYGMLSGSFPFNTDETGGNAIMALTFQISKVPAPSLNTLPGVSVHPAVEAIVAKCLAKNPDDRYQSARELREAVESAKRAIEADMPTQGQVIEQKYSLGPVVRGGSAVGSGEYHSAIQTSNNSPVTIKLMTAFTTEERQALLREISALINLNHPYIAAVKEVGITANQMAFIVMEDVGEENVRERIKKGPIDKDTALEIGVQVCQGMVFAHKKGHVHRNLKPESVFTKEEDGKIVAKIVDLGFGRMPSRISASILGAKVTTAKPYIAPECLEGKPISPTDPRLDVYAVGIMLYEMLGGKLSGEMPAKLVYEGTQLEDASNNALRLIIERATAHKPEERYQTMEQLHNAISSIVTIRAMDARSENTFVGEIKDLVGPAGGATLPPPEPTVEAPKRRYGLAVGLGLLGAMTAAGFVVGASRFMGRAGMHETRITAPVTELRVPNVPSVAVQVPAEPVAPPVVAPPMEVPVADAGVVTHNITFTADAKRFEVYIADQNGNPTGDAICSSGDNRMCIAQIPHGSQPVSFVLRRQKRDGTVITLPAITVTPDTNRSADPVSFNQRREGESNGRRSSRHRHREGGDLSGAMPDI